MAQHLTHRFAVADGVGRADIAAALESVTGDDLTEKSPVTAGVPEAAITLITEQAGKYVEVRVEGHDGEWSKTSMDAIRSAVLSVDGVRERVATRGGYDPE